MALLDGRICEVRIPARLSTGAHAIGGVPPLSDTVRRLHRRGLLASAVGVGDTELCHTVIEAGFDLLQGDLIGRGHDLGVTVSELSDALPFGRTTL
jgi:hypothetical protein